MHRRDLQYSSGKSRIARALRVTDDRVAVRNARIGDLQAESRGAADDRLVTAEYQQPRARRVAIHREQTCSLSSSQHGRLEYERTAFGGGRHRR